MQDVPMTTSPIELARLDQLKTLFQEVHVQSAQCPSLFTTLRGLLLYQKQLVNGQDPVAHPALFAPKAQISMSQSNAMLGSPQSARNMSRLSSGSKCKYNPAQKGRISDAQAKDPTSYSLHRLSLSGGEIQCPCGVMITNSKHSRAYHKKHNKIHKDWIARREDVVVDNGAFPVASNVDTCDVQSFEEQVGDCVAERQEQDDVNGLHQNRRKKTKFVHISDSLKEQILEAVPYDGTKSPQENALEHFCCMVSPPFLFWQNRKSFTLFWIPRVYSKMWGARRVLGELYFFLTCDMTFNEKGN
jgi:hypothetical protein